MRFLVLVFAALLFSFKGFAQADVVKQLQANKWFVAGTLGEKSLTLNSKTTADWEATFMNKGQLKYCAKAKTEMPDPVVAGKNIAAGTPYCDTQYTYEVKNNVININYGPANFFYTIKKLANGFELTPTDHTNFK